MTSTQFILGASASILGFIGYFFYIRDMVRGKTKPHVFSWFLWGLSTGIAFLAQIVKGGGAGAWVTGLTAFMCLGIAVGALRNGTKNITHSDWVCLAGGMVGIALWRLTGDPLATVIIIMITDIISTLPTFRKAYYKPYEETVSTYVLSAVKFIPAIAALGAFNLTTVLYPTSLILMNGSFVVMLVMRRKKV